MCPLACQDDLHDIHRASVIDGPVPGERGGARDEADAAPTVTASAGSFEDLAAPWINACLRQLRRVRGWLGLDRRQVARTDRRNAAQVSGHRLKVSACQVAR